MAAKKASTAMKAMSAMKASRAMKKKTVMKAMKDKNAMKTACMKASKPKLLPKALRHLPPGTIITPYHPLWDLANKHIPQ